MRWVVYMTLIPLMSVASIDSTTSLEHQSRDVDTNVIAPLHLLSKEARRERRKERRILRKKKQRLRELREEIRILTLSLQQPNSTAVFDKTEVKLKQKGRQGRKGIKWRKSLLEKLKGIVRRLDRMERRLLESNQIVSSEVIPSTTSASSTSTSTTTTTSITTSSINDALNQKLKRIQPAISRSRSGENGAACSAHKDCRPGHCCHLVVGKDGTKSTCVIHRLLEGGECVDGCQCSTQFSCFLPDTRLSRNSTKAFCKRATSSDILTGSYLYQKDSIIVDSESD